MNAIYGKIELNNGQVLDWMRFASDDAEAIQLVIDQHAGAKRCWVVECPEESK